jgi:hypothetical protein
MSAIAPRDLSDFAPARLPAVRSVENPRMGDLPGPLSRRGFFAGVGAGALGLSSLGAAIEALRGAAPAYAQLGLSPDDPAVRATIEAYADTIVPGPAGGAHSEPGAVEAGAVDEAYDPYYGALNVFPAIHQDLQLATPLVLGRPARFDLKLPYPDRERVVLSRMTLNPSPLYVLYQGVAIVIYVAFYGTARSELGPRFIGFPPRSDGYWPGHSYKVRFRRMTRHGLPR